MEADKDGDGKLSFEEFSVMVANTVRGRPHRFDTASSFPIFIFYLGHRETNDSRGPFLSSQLSFCFLVTRRYTSLELCSSFLYASRFVTGLFGARYHDGEV